MEVRPRSEIIHILDGKVLAHYYPGHRIPEKMKDAEVLMESSGKPEEAGAWFEKTGSFELAQGNLNFRSKNTEN